MKRVLALKTERLNELTTEELHVVAGAQRTLVCVFTNGPVGCIPAVRTLDGCLTGDYSIAC